MDPSNETPESLILFEAPPNSDVATIAPHFQQQLLQYFDLLDEYSTYYSEIYSTPGPNVLSRYGDLTMGQPTSRYVHLHRNAWMNQPANVADRNRIPMLDNQRKMRSMEPLIRELINIVGWHRLTNGTNRRLFLCLDVEDIRAVQIYRRLMPPNFPEVRIVLDVCTTDYLRLEEVADGIQFLTTYRFMQPR